MQLVEFGHTVPSAGGVSGRLPAEGNAGVKGLLQGVVQQRVGLSSACASPCSLAHGSS